MSRGLFRAAAYAAAGLMAAVGTASAGGLTRDTQDFDILFLDGTQTQAGVTYVMPERRLKNIHGSPAANNAPPFGTGGIDPVTGRRWQTSTDESEAYFIPRFSAKFDLTDDLACAGQYRTPWGAHNDVGTDTALALSSIEQKITSADLGVNCSYRFRLGHGYLRALGGISYQYLHGEQTQLLLTNSVLAKYAPLLGPLQAFRLEGFEAAPDINGSARIGHLDVDGSSIGWRGGIAYEIPEIAFRAQLIYQSEVDYDLDGHVNDFFRDPIAVHAEAKLPQSLEMKFQTGIAPTWLGFGSVRWTDWSVENSVKFNAANAYYGGLLPSGTNITSLDLDYRDGWTVTGGVGHAITDSLSVAGSVTWDRGVSTGLTSQTDAWLFGLGGAYTPMQNVELRLNGVLGILTSGSLDLRSVKPSTGSAADFGTDLVSAVSLSARVRF